MDMSAQRQTALRALDLLSLLDKKGVELVLFALQMHTGDYSAESQLSKSLLMQKGADTGPIADLMRLIERLDGDDLAYALGAGEDNVIPLLL